MCCIPNTAGYLHLAWREKTAGQGSVSALQFTYGAGCAGLVIGSFVRGTGLVNRLRHYRQQRPFTKDPEILMVALMPDDSRLSGLVPRRFVNFEYKCSRMSFEHLFRSARGIFPPKFQLDALLASEYILHLLYDVAAPLWYIPNPEFGNRLGRVNLHIGIQS